MEKTPHGVYNGDWKEGFKHGKGLMKYKNGDEYDGEWFDGQLSGHGIYK